MVFTLSGFIVSFFVRKKIAQIIRIICFLSVIYIILSLISSEIGQNERDRLRNEVGFLQTL